MAVAAVLTATSDLKIDQTSSDCKKLHTEVGTDTNTYRVGSLLKQSGNSLQCIYYMVERTEYKAASQTERHDYLKKVSY